MNFEDYYKEAEKALSKTLPEKLRGKVRDLQARFKEWAQEYYNEHDSEGEPVFTPEETAEEFVSYLKELDAEGGLSEAAEPWSVEFKDIWGNEQTETFEDEKSAWARYNELSARTHGDMSDILWVEEPEGPVSEDGSSAASLGVGPNAVKKNESVSDKDVEDFLHNALDNAVLGDDVTINIKFIADGTGGFELRALTPSGENKLLKSGGLFAVTDYFRELLDMPMENAITLIEGA